MKRKKNIGFIERNFEPTKAGKNLSWASVIAGAVTFVSVFLVLTLVTSSLGFGFISPTSSNPFQGVGLATGISTVISLAFSMFAGGFVAGLSARKTGLLHGFLTWALAVILLLSLVTSLITSVANTAINVTSSVVSTTSSAVGTVASKATQAAGNGLDSIFNKASEELSNVNTDKLDNDVKSILADTDIPQLQPKYLNNILDESKNEVVEAGKQLLTNPNDYKTILDDLTSSLKEKADTIGEAIDKEAITSAVQKNTDLSQEEANKTVNNIINEYNNVQNQAKEQVEKLQVSIDETTQQAKKTVEELKVSAENTSNTLSKGFLIVFLGLILGLVLSSLGGILGSKKVKNTIIEE